MRGVSSLGVRFFFFFSLGGAYRVYPLLEGVTSLGGRYLSWRALPLLEGVWQVQARHAGEMCGDVEIHTIVSGLKRRILYTQHALKK